MLLYSDQSYGLQLWVQVSICGLFGKFGLFQIIRLHPHWGALRWTTPQDSNKVSMPQNIMRALRCNTARLYQICLLRACIGKVTVSVRPANRISCAIYFNWPQSYGIRIANSTCWIERLLNCGSFSVPGWQAWCNSNPPSGCFSPQVRMNHAYYFKLHFLEMLCDRHHSYWGLLELHTVTVLALYL